MGVEDGDVAALAVEATYMANVEDATSAGVLEAGGCAAEESGGFIPREAGAWDPDRAAEVAEEAGVEGDFFDRMAGRCVVLDP